MVTSNSAEMAKKDIKINLNFFIINYVMVVVFYHSPLSTRMNTFPSRLDTILEDTLLGSPLVNTSAHCSIELTWVIL